MLENLKPTFLEWEQAHHSDLSVLYQEYLREIVVYNKKFNGEMVESYENWARKKGGFNP